jgi:transcriptional regulator with PAS, ATPase and Fis domain
MSVALSSDERALDQLTLEFPNQTYCTYAAGDEAVGPVVTALWLLENHISDILRLENESGLRILPRYSPHNDRLSTAMMEYCYKRRLELDLVAANFIENAEFFFVKMKNEVNPWQKRIAENFELLRILTTSHRDPDVDYLAYIEKIGTTIPQELEDEYFKKYGPEFDHGPDFSEWLEKKGVHIREVVQDKEERISLPDDQGPAGSHDFPSYERMGEVIWAKFNNADVQDLLSSISVKLINDYIEIVAKADFAPGLVWKLKDQYLQEIYKTVISPSTSMLFRQELDEEELKEVKEAESRFKGVNIISNDRMIKQIKVDISRMARVEYEGVSFLLLGESGTGKELFAKAIHEASGRNGRYIVSDCGAKSETLFESQLFGHLKGAFTGAVNDKKGDFELAEGGTIFLDEIGNLAPSLQPKMLRVLREQEIQPLGAEYAKKVDVKVVLATNRDLAKMVEKGEFKKDLYQRFKRPQFLIPPLRERKGDLPRLVKHFLEKYDTFRATDSSIPAINVTSQCLAILTEYEWRDGNIGELEKVILEIMLKRGGGQDRRDITPADLPIEILEGGRGDCLSGKDRQEKSWPPSDEELLALEREGKKRTKVAEIFGVERETVSRAYSKIRKRLASEAKSSGG